MRSLASRESAPSAQERADHPPLTTRTPRSTWRCLFTAASLCCAPALATAQSARLGAIDFPTSAHPPAQRAFITGVLYLHSFEYESAAAAFREAQRLQPGFALAYWGEAMTYTHPVWNEQDTAAARAALRRLAPTADARRAKAPTPREQRFLGAVEALYGTGTKATRDTAYERAMAQLAQRYPGDNEVQTFYALALLGLNQGVRDVPTYMRAGAIAEAVFATNPNHPGAAHYIIHAFDDPVHAPLGLRAARAYSSIAPDAAHAQHMTSHIFVAMGMWDETVHANEVATVAVRDTATKEARWSCGHYAEWLHYGYLQQGRPRAAAMLMGECVAKSKGQSPGRSARMRMSAQTMRAEEIVHAEGGANLPLQPPIDTSGFDGYSLSLADFSNGWAAASGGDIKALRAALAALRSHAAAIDKGDAEAGYAEILQRELTALAARNDKRDADAIAQLERAVAIEDSLPVDFGPPADPKPPRELLGETLLQVGRATDAERVLEQQLQRTPRRALTLSALARAAQASGRADRAVWARDELAAVWHAKEQGVGSRE